MVSDGGAICDRGEGEAAWIFLVRDALLCHRTSLGKYRFCPERP